jgi:hypothetical protein
VKWQNTNRFLKLKRNRKCGGKESAWIICDVINQSLNNQDVQLQEIQIIMIEGGKRWQSARNAEANRTSVGELGSSTEVLFWYDPCCTS